MNLLELCDFQELLLNRYEIERALELNLPQALATDGQCLDDYSMFSTIPLEDVVAIFLNLNPTCKYHNKNHPRYLPILKAVETAVRRREIQAEITQDFDINGNEIQYDISLTHDTAKAWAKTHGLNWNIPPYRPVGHTDNDLEPSQSITETEKDEIIKKLRDESAELKARIAELEANQAAGAVNSSEVLEYRGEVPPATDNEKLADFIDLLLHVGNIKNAKGLTPTYSELHTILNRKIKDRRIPSKATIQKYMNKTNHI